MTSTLGCAVLVIDDRGRLVVPADLRERLHWVAGTPIIAIEREGGLELISRAALKKRVQESFRGGPDLVDELIHERRAEAARDASE